VPIEFFDLLDDGGWAPRALDQTADGHRWSDGGPLADAPVDVDATFRDARRVATGVDPTFRLTGIRLGAGFVVPRHHHDQQVLRIVIGGSFTVRADDEVATVSGGQFCTIDAGTVHSLVAGPGGVTYTESWHLDVADVVTTWHPDPAWVAR
jgi:quercetin dioxygenase-like cupin family protein